MNLLFLSIWIDTEIQEGERKREKKKIVVNTRQYNDDKKKQQINETYMK